MLELELVIKPIALLCVDYTHIIHRILKQQALVVVDGCEFNVLEYFLIILDTLL